MSHISTSPTASSMGVLDGLIPNSGTSPVIPNPATGDVSIVTNTPGADGAASITAGTNPTTTVGSLNTVTITQNVQTIVSGTTAAAGSLDIFTYTMINETGISLSVQLAGVIDTTATFSWGGNIVGAMSASGGVALVDYVLKNCDGPDTGIQADFVVSGLDIILRLTGSGVSIYNWNALVTYIQVSS